MQVSNEYKVNAAVSITLTILIKKTAKIKREVMESPCRSGSSPKISGELPAWDEFDDNLVSVIEHER